MQRLVEVIQLSVRRRERVSVTDVVPATSNRVTEKAYVVARDLTFQFADAPRLPLR